MGKGVIQDKSALKTIKKQQLQKTSTKVIQKKSGDSQRAELRRQEQKQLEQLLLLDRNAVIAKVRTSMPPNSDSSVQLPALKKKQLRAKQRRTLKLLASNPQRD